jgi:hypothetical protein
MNDRSRRLRLRRTTTVIAAALVAAVGAVGATAAREDAPQTKSPPTIEGTLQAGKTVNAGNGVWSNDPTSFTYQWQRCNSSGTGCADVKDATSKSYDLTGDDVDHTVVVLVTAANSDGKATANSHPSAVISGTDAPRNTQRPSISGSAQVGETLKVSQGEWTGGARTFAYQWMVCDENGSNCNDVSGATASSYGVRSADSGKTIRVRVTAENLAGKTTVTTDRSSQIKAAANPSPTPPPTTTNGCSGSSSQLVVASSLLPPTRMLIDRWSFEPNVVHRDTRFFTARVHVADTCGHSVGGAQVWSTAIPYNQTSTLHGTTTPDGWATLRFSIQRGFPANPSRQQILAMLVRATKPGGSVLAGVSTRRTVRLNVNLHR